MTEIKDDIKEMRDLSAQIYSDSIEFHAYDEALASELAEVAKLGRQYALRCESHNAIIAEAKARAGKGENLDTVYREQADKLLATWPDAEGYGSAIVMLKEVLLQRRG